MKRSDQDRLLQDVFADENLVRLRERSLAGGLAALRQRRRRRALLATASSLAVAVLVFVVAQRRPASAPAVAFAQKPAVKFITDDQLFALFPNRPAALVGPPGAQQFIFLDQPATPSTEGKTR